MTGAPKALVLLIVATVVGYVFLVAPMLQTAADDERETMATPTTTEPATPQPPQRSPEANPVDFPAAGTVFTGVFTAKGPHDFTEIDAFTEVTGQESPVVPFSVGWEYDRFDRDLLDAIAMRGSMPLVYWEPWDYQAGSPREDQPDYALAEIIDGRYDAYIAHWARGVAELGYPIGMRFAHEMNGTWYPWAEAVNGNEPGEYVQAWRHVHDIFEAEGATDVIWIWSPNVSYEGAPDLGQLYPGDEYVDWAGLAGYLGTPGQEDFVPFNDVFYWSVEQIREITDKPIVITETGAPSGGSDQAEWIADMFESLPTYLDVIGVVWFEADAGKDFRLVGQPDSEAAYREATRDTRYDVSWTPNIRPLQRPQDEMEGG